MPIDFGGHRSSGIAAIAYRKLRGGPRAAGHDRSASTIPIQQLAIIDEDVLERFGVDMIELGRGFALDEQAIGPTGPAGRLALPNARLGPARAAAGPMGASFAQRAGCWRRCPTGRSTSSSATGPISRTTTSTACPRRWRRTCGAGLRRRPARWLPVPDGPQRLAEGARKLRERTDRAIVGLFGGNLLEMRPVPLPHRQLLDAAGGRSAAGARVPRSPGGNPPRPIWNSYLAAVGPYIDIIVFGDDLGMQNGPQMSPAMYREFFKPRHARMWRRAKELADVKVMLHCCGGVRPLLADLIDAGLDAINPVQISCTGMDAAELKADFGDRLTFWGGGCDTRFVLSRGHAGRRSPGTSAAGRPFSSPGGGFVFQQVHNILANVPPENVIAMFDAVREG